MSNDPRADNFIRAVADFTYAVGRRSEGENISRFRTELETRVAASNLFRTVFGEPPTQKQIAEMVDDN